MKTPIKVEILEQLIEELFENKKEKAALAANIQTQARTIMDYIDVVAKLKEKIKNLTNDKK